MRLSSLEVVVLSFSLVEGLVEEVVVYLGEGVERRPSFLEEVGVATSRP